MKKQSGFTLIELMVVMAIIAVLATAGISAYTDYIKKARDTTRLSIASQVETAVNALMGSNGGVPPDSGELITYLGTLNMTAAIDALNGEEPRLLSSVGSMVRDFVGGSPLYAFIREPSGGRAICMGYDGSGTVTGGHSCAFQYIVYGDNTYVIGYGIETETNMKVNFYNVATAAGGASQYMQVKGTAQYVGMPSIGETDGPAKDSVAFMVSKVVVDQDGTVTNNDLSSVIDETRSAPLSDETGGGGGGGLGLGEVCESGSGCASGYCGGSAFGSKVCTDGNNGAQCSNGLASPSEQCASGYCSNRHFQCTDGYGSCDYSAPPANQCASGYCNAEACSDGGFGSACSAQDTQYVPGNQQCATGYCNSTTCGNGTNGESCDPNYPNPSGSNTYSDQCVSGICDQNTSLCTSGGGTLQTGDACSTGSECASGICFDYQWGGNVCRPNINWMPCSDNQVCGEGFECAVYACTDRENHSPCWGNNYCNSGYCYAASAANRGGFGSYTCTDGAAGAGCGIGNGENNCQPGLTCVPDGLGEGGVCTAGLPNGASCNPSTPGDCTSGICSFDSMCGGGWSQDVGCTNDQQCRDGLTCWGGVCSNGMPGDYCNYDYQCSSGTCDGNGSGCL